MTTDALALGKALAGDASWVTGAALVDAPRSPSTGLVTASIAGFPTTGEKATILSTGDPGILTRPNSSGGSGSGLGGGSTGSRGPGAFDVTTLRVDLQVPATANCLVGMDFRFLSEEYPEYVGSSFNDAFVAELDKTTWTTSGSAISAPDNFAFDPTGNPISINAAGVTSMTDEEAAGTTFDGATPILTAATPLTPGKHSLYLSIFDQGDSSLDSAVIVDNLRLGTVGKPSECKPGAVVSTPKRYVALGDSYSSGFGLGVYYDGTYKDEGPNDCQRSPLAYGPRVATTLGLNLDGADFNACQGAVTQDFYKPRVRDKDKDFKGWNEPAQLTHLDKDVGLVTFSIGGNDAQFSYVYGECALGFELLPWNTCHQEEKVARPVRQAIARLDGKETGSVDGQKNIVYSYDSIFRTAMLRSPRASRVAVGYPQFFPSRGQGGSSIFFGRCNGIKLVDQRWISTKISEVNKIQEQSAQRYGGFYASPDFGGHELCGTGEEWINPVLSSGGLDPGRVHPTANGHAAMAEAVVDAIGDDGKKKFTVKQGQKVTYSFVVGPKSPFISLVTGWPGSDVGLTLRSPSDRVIDRGTKAADVLRETEPTLEHVEVSTPEPGTWTAELAGLDVPAAAGEPVTLSVYEEPPLNVRPTARITTSVVDGKLVLDASTSSDADGSIASVDWYVSTATTDEVSTGTTVSRPLADAGGRSYTAVVTDDRGLTDFAEVDSSGIVGTPSAAVQGKPYTFALTLGGTPAPTASVAAGSLPPGITLSPAGVLSGTPTAAGTFPVTVAAANGIGPAATAKLTLVVDPGSTPPPKGPQNLASTLTASATTVPAGGEVAVTLKVTNQGPAPATTYSAGIKVPQGWTVIDPAGGTVKNGVVIFTAKQLDATSTREHAVRFKAAGAGAQQVSGYGFSKTPEKNLNDNVAVAIVKVT